jgi:hypothetical protein
VSHGSKTLHKALSNNPSPTMLFLCRQKGVFEKVVMEGLEEMFEGDSAEGGNERIVKRAQTVSKDAHRRERKFKNIIRGVPYVQRVAGGMLQSFFFE